MFYALLILPHIAAITGLLMFAFREGSDGRPEDPGIDWFWDQDPPTPPAPRPEPATGPPLPDARQPRRLQVGEQLSERTVRRPRREPVEPERAPQNPREPERTPR
jgi:hypothetical protein